MVLAFIGVPLPNSAEVDIMLPPIMPLTVSWLLLELRKASDANPPQNLPDTNEITSATIATVNTSTIICKIMVDFLSPSDR